MKKVDSNKSQPFFISNVDYFFCKIILILVLLLCIEDRVATLMEKLLDNILVFYTVCI